MKLTLHNSTLRTFTLLLYFTSLINEIATHFLIFLGLLLLIFGNLEEDVLQGGLRKLVVFKIQLPFACIRMKFKS